MMKVLKDDQVDRIYGVTDRMNLHRDWVVVPLNAAVEGREVMMPDGKLLIRGPSEADRFEPWIAGLEDRLQDLDLRRVPPCDEDDPKRDLTGPGSPEFRGTLRYLDPCDVPDAAADQRHGNRGGQDA